MRALVALSTLAVVLATLAVPTEGFQPRRIMFARCSADEPVPRALFMSCANRRGICDVRQGQNHILRAIFIPSVNTTDVDSYVVWNTFAQLPLPNQQRDACDGEIQCPLVTGRTTHFTYSLEIQTYWPRGEFPVIWTLSDKETDEPILCFKFKINIV